MDTSPSDSLEDLLLSADEKSVELGLQLLEHETDATAYIRPLTLIAYCSPLTFTGKACRIFLHKNFPHTHQQIQDELSFLTDSWQLVVTDKEDYMEELQHFEQFYQTYLECNRDYGQQIYETIAQQLIAFKENDRAATYYARLSDWFPQKANYWYQCAKLGDYGDTDYLSILLHAVHCSDAQPIHHYELALSYWRDLHQQTNALKWVQQALRQAPEYAPAHCLLGDLYASNQKWSLAATAYKEAVKFDLKTISYQNRYAVSILAQPNISTIMLDYALAHASTAYRYQHNNLLYCTTQAIAFWLCANKMKEAFEILQPAMQTPLGAVVRVALEQNNPILLKSYFEHYPNELLYETLE